MFLQILFAIAIAVACVYIGRVVGKWFFGVDAKLKERKRAALKLAIALREYGMRLLPSCLEAYAVFDVPEMIEKMREAETLIDAGPDSILKELDATYDRVLDKKLSTPEGRSLMKAKIADMEAAKR